MSKSKDGFTLSIKILDKLDKTVADSSTYSNSLTEDVDFSVTAVRLLVGSILQANIPRQLKIMGRTHSLTSGSKRWYTFYLTAQEVALSVRNGFISIVVGQCFDSSICPALEAIELYALERKLIERWLPSTLHSSISTMGHCGRKVVAHNTRETFRVSLMALASSNGLLRSLKLHGEEKMFLTQIIVNSTLNDQDPEVEEATIRLLTSMIRDEETRQAFYDMSVLNGCSDFLLKCKYTLDEVRLMKNPSQFHPVWLALIPSIRNCLQTAARIARQRPFNYLQAADASIVEYASNCINECFKESLVNDDLVSDLVELSLLETAVANGTPRGNFGSFSGLMGLLANPNQAVVSQASLSICRFCQVCDLFNSPAITVKYICDSCLLFINDSRFTLLDDDHAFDLCPECYHIATGLVIDENCRDSDSVIINGKPVGDKVQLTCGEVQVLQPVAIQKYLTDGDSGSDAKGNPDKLELFNDFMDCLCTGIAGLLGDELREKPLLPSSFLWLSVDLVRHSLIRGRKTARAKRLAEAIAFRLCSKLEALPKGANLSDDCIVLFEALMCLFAPDRSVRDFFFGTRSDFVDVEHDANTEVVCEVHKARARLRRFTEGPDKDRCFLSCSKTANNCCTFFVWHDQLDTLSGSAQSNVSLFSDSIAMFVWELFASPLTDTGSSMNSILISFVEQIWNQNQSLCEKRQTLSAALRSEVKSIGCDLQKIYADGVVCSLARLADDAILDNMICHDQKSKLPQAGSVAFDCDTLAVEKCLELISLVASPDAQRTHEWFPILCRIMLSDKAQSSPYDTLRVLAKRSIKHLCGRDSGLSYAVRDHFVFTFHCDRLLTCANDMFKTCAMLNEKARQCGLEWTTGNPLTFRRLTMGHFVGTEFLISEDISNFQVNERLSKLLTQLWTEASKRPRGWNRFCGLSTFSASSSSKESDLDAPPILYILAVACAASPANQLIAIRLLNLALSFPNESKESSLKCEEPSKLNEINNTNELVCSHSVLVPGRLSSLYSNTLKPEDILISTISELHNFVMRFVYRGPSTEIRVLSCSVAKRLCQEFDTKSLGVLIERLMRNSFCLVGRTGKQSAEFFSFLQTAVKLAGSSVVDVTRFTGVVQTSLKNQILAMRHDRANCEFMQLEITASTGVQKKRFDFAACDSCRFNESRYKESRPDKSTFASTSDLRALSSTRSNPDHADLPKTKWLNQQVSPFSRGRLDSSRDSCTSSEFCLFFSLKHRCVVSTIHVEVENPRRLVKTIKVFSSSRPVDDASLLKSPEFVNNWQPCGVLTLTRGCARDSLTLPTPVVAANIKIEFVDFYERPGGSKAADGTLIVHCPRCTRVVTNAHGVCANCGEVAFQCRKCRHINYDRLDAFLCVECGFCSSGTFQFELTSAVATNGIAILSDRDYSRSLQRYGTAASLHQDLKAALKQKLIDLVRGRKKGQSDNEEDQDLDLFPSLRRAFQGNLSLEPHETEEDHDHTKLTLNHLGKPGSMVKAIARSADAVSTNNPLFQYRTDRRRNLSGSSRTDGFLGQFGIRDPEGDDTVSVIGGLLDGSSALSRFANLDPGDPLSRLLASVQSRRDRRNTGAAEATATLSALGTSQNRCSQKDTLEVCDRLYGMMREAEREMYELHRRCAAWRQLDMGSLIEDGTTGTQETAPSFEPSHCCVCAVTMTMHLLSLWLCLFELKPDAVELNEEFISLLLNGDPASSLKNITETKHNAIKDIAVYSTQGRPLVLEALRLRLIYLHDPSVAEILGQIMQSLRDDSEAAAPFLALAEEALESGLS